MTSKQDFTDGVSPAQAEPAGDFKPREGQQVLDQVRAVLGMA